MSKSIRTKLKTNHQWTGIILALILAWGLITRIYRIDQPKTYYFDEVYHAFTAEAYSRNDPRGYEWWHTSPMEGTAYEWLHPPLSKLLMGASIRVLGNVSYAWRLPSVIFGVLTLAGVFFLTVTVLKNKPVALLATFLSSLDGLLLTQSRIAMNDIFLVFFVLMALGFYWKWQEKSGSKLNLNRRIDHRNTEKYGTTENTESGYLLLSGMFGGLAVATKWSGVFVIGIIGVWELVRFIRLIYQRLSGNLATTPSKLKKIMDWRRWLKLAISFGLIPMAMYILSYSQFWLQGHTWDQFRELHNQIWWYETNLEATHPYQSKPWQWVLNLKPVWYFVDYNQTGKIGNIYALANPMIAWGGLAGIVWLLALAVYREKGKYWFLVLAYAMFWVPWTMSPRIMFFYHYAPSIPFLAIGLANLAWCGWKTKWWPVKGLGLAVVVATAAMFGYFYPHWTGILLPTEWVEKYYWFKSWK